MHVVNSTKRVSFFTVRMLCLPALRAV